MDTNNTVGTEYSELSLEQMKLSLEAQRTRGKGYLPTEASKQVFARLEAEKARIRDIAKEARENGRPSPFLMPFEIETVPLDDIGVSFKRPGPDTPYFNLPENIVDEIRKRKSDEPRESDSIVIRRLRRSFGLAKATCRLMISSYGLQKMRRALDHVTDLKRALTAALKERRLTSWIERAKAGADKEEALSAAEKVAAKNRRLEFERGKREGAREQRNKAEAAELKKSDQIKRNRRVIDRALASVQQGRQPNVKDVDDLIVVDEIDPEAVSNKSARPTKKVASVAGDPFMKDIRNGNRKGRYGSEICKLVGDELRRLYAAEEVGSVHALDPGADRIDRGGYSSSGGYLRIDAIVKLGKVESVVGPDGAMVLRWHIGECKRLHDIAEQDNPSSPTALRQGKAFWGTVLDRSLDLLAVEWGFVQCAGGGYRKSAAGG